MPLQPPPPSITPRQMNLLRIVASLAWSDGHLAAEEIDLMLNRFSGLFSQSSEQQQHLQQELRDYLMQNIPLEELVPRLESAEERELVLKLGYEVICASSRTPDEPVVNLEEAQAYKKLLQLLNLPPEVIDRLETEASAAVEGHQGMIETLTSTLRNFFS